jgi:hypothetical protein
MKTLGFSRFLAINLAALLTLIPAGNSIAKASASEVFRFDVNQTQTLDLCGFPIVRQDVGTLIIQDHYDSNGALVFENVIFSNWRITFTNPANGKSVSSVRAYNERFVQYDDGSYKAVSAGLVAHLVIPGQGVVASNVGIISVRFDASDKPISILVAGEHDGPITQFVCPYLA